MNDLSPLTATIWLGIWVYFLQVFFKLLDGAAIRDSDESDLPRVRLARSLANKALVLPGAFLLASVAALAVGALYATVLPWGVNFVLWARSNLINLFSDLVSSPTSEITYASGRQVFAVGVLLVLVPYLLYVILRTGFSWTTALLQARLPQWIESEVKTQGSAWLDVGLVAARRRASRRRQEPATRLEFVFGSRGERVFYLVAGVVGLLAFASFGLLVFGIIFGGFTGAVPIQVIFGAILTFTGLGAVAGGFRIVSLAYLRYWAAPRFMARQELEGLRDAAPHEPDTSLSNKPHARGE